MGPIGYHKMYQYVHYRGPEAGGRERGVESLFEKLTVEKFPDLMRDINLHILEAPQTLKRDPHQDTL